MIRRVLFIVSFNLAFAGASFFAQTNVTNSIRDFRKADENRLLSEFVKLLSIPNVASDTANIRKNADYLGVEILKPRLL